MNMNELQIHIHIILSPYTLIYTIVGSHIISYPGYYAWKGAPMFYSFNANDMLAAT